MVESYEIITIRLLAAVVIGAIIGFERTFHGRPAGFRTHAIVCTSSALLMLLMVFQWALVPAQFMDTVRVDPTRMAQGIMTGIGFLGAGVIMKEGLTVRGLTTAASIWMTASIGIMIGMGFYFAALFASILTIGILSLFRWVESSMPSLQFGRLVVRTLNSRHLSEDRLLDMMEKHGIKGYSPSYSVCEGGAVFEYQMTVKTRKLKNFRKLAEALRGVEEIHEFSLMPRGD